MNDFTQGHKNLIKTGSSAYPASANSY